MFSVLIKKSKECIMQRDFSKIQIQIQKLWVSLAPFFRITYVSFFSRYPFFVFRTCLIYFTRITHESPFTVVGSGEPAGVSFLGDLSVSGNAKSSASSSSLEVR